MTIEAYYDSSARMIIIRVAAEITRENIVQSVRRGLELSEQYSCNAMLFDIRQCWMRQTLEEASTLMKDPQTNLGWLPQHTVAVVYNPATYPVERAAVIERVTTGGTHASFRMFTDLHAALTWLHNFRAHAS